MHRTKSARRNPPAREGAFTLIELMVVISIISILASMLLPVLAGAKAKARNMQCVNGVRQLGMALQMFVDESQGKLPARCHPNEWCDQMFPYYREIKLLRCPVDSDPQTSGHDPIQYPAASAPRSYVMNGWNDYYQSRGIDPNVAGGTQISLHEGLLQESSEIVVFGEKENDSRHFHMDYNVYDDLKILDQIKHRTGGTGGANYIFADGSWRFLRLGQSFSPINLWAVLPEVRKAALPTPP